MTRSASADGSEARVAVLVPNGLKKKDGTSVRAARIIPIIAASFRTTVLAGREADGPEDYAFREAPVRYFSVLKRDTFANPFKLLALNLRLLSRLIRGSFDVVYAPGAFALPLLPSLFFASRLGGPKFIYEAHALAFRERAQVSKLQPLLLLPAEILAGRLSSGIVALSGEARKFFSKVGRRVFFVPVFVDIRAYETARPGDHRGVKKVGLVGPFDGIFNEGQLEFLLANVDGFDDRIRFVLIGRLARRVDVGRVSSVGFLSDEEYSRELRDLDALMVPVSLATLGPKNKIIEAMACGLPVFTSPEGVVGLDFARPGENILVFPLDQIVERVNALIFEEERLEGIGRSARRTVEDYYGAEACGEMIVEAIEEVLRNK